MSVEMELKILSVTPEVLIDLYSESQRDKKRKEANIELFAKDIARQCVQIDIMQKDLAKGKIHRGAVYTVRQLRDVGVQFMETVPDEMRVRVDL